MNGKFERTSMYSWIVESPTGKTYSVQIVQDDGQMSWKCDCPSFVYGGADYCKHCEAVISKFDLEVEMN
jgi:uncharacterized Zn finger protein